jgi:hypothetical protein
MQEDEGLSMCPICGRKTNPKIFNVDDFEIHGAECSKCKKTLLKENDVFRYANFKKGATAADRVIC